MDLFLKTIIKFSLIIGLVFNGIVATSCSMFKEALPKERQLVLEITTEKSATSYPYGQFLELKLYNDRKVEFDFYPERNVHGGNLRFKKMAAELNEQDYMRISSLLKNPDLLNARNSYETRRISPMSIDSKIKKPLLSR